MARGGGESGPRPPPRPAFAVAAPARPGLSWMVLVAPVAHLWESSIMPSRRLLALLAALFAGGCGLQSPLAPSLQAPLPGFRTIALRSVSDPRLPAAGDEL